MARVNRKQRAHDNAGALGRKWAREVKEWNAAPKCEKCGEPMKGGRCVNRKCFIGRK